MIEDLISRLLNDYVWPGLIRLGLIAGVLILLRIALGIWLSERRTAAPRQQPLASLAALFSIVASQHQVGSYWWNHTRNALAKFASEFTSAGVHAVEADSLLIKADRSLIDKAALSALDENFKDRLCSEIHSLCTNAQTGETFARDTAITAISLVWDCTLEEGALKLEMHRQRRAAQWQRREDRSRRHREQQDRRRQPSREHANTEREEALAVLGLSGDPTQAEIRRAYIKLVQRHHPDTVADKHKTDANDQTAEINDAYDYLVRGKGS